MSIETLCWLTAAAAIAAYWLHHNKLSQQAMMLARDHVQQQGLQFLDQNAVLCRLRIGRSRYFGAHLVRTYRFEFAALGDRRYHGWITLAGTRVRSIELQPFREPNAERGPDHTLH